MQRYFKPVCLFVAILCVFSSGYLIAQEQEPKQTGKKATPAAEIRFEMELTETQAHLHVLRDTLEDKSLDKGFVVNEKLSTLYSKAASNPDLSNAVRTRVISKYYEGTLDTKSAVQASQNLAEQSFRLQLLQTAQNEEIIRQLKQLNAKK